MRRPAVVDQHLQALLEEASRKPMTPEARVRQVASLAYGNLKLVDDRVTRVQVTTATEAIFAAAQAAANH